MNEALAQKPLPSTQPLATPHRHRFIFAVGEGGAIRGCEFCGRAWVLPQTNSIWRGR